MFLGKIPLVSEMLRDIKDSGLLLDRMSVTFITRYSRQACSYFTNWTPFLVDTKHVHRRIASTAENNQNISLDIQNTSASFKLTSHSCLENIDLLFFVYAW